MYLPGPPVPRTGPLQGLGADGEVHHDFGMSVICSSGPTAVLEMVSTLRCIMGTLRGTMPRPIVEFRLTLQHFYVVACTGNCAGFVIRCDCWLFTYPTEMWDCQNALCYGVEEVNAAPQEVEAGVPIRWPVMLASGWSVLIDHRELLQNTISAEVVKFLVGLSGRVGRKKGGLGWECESF